MRITILTNQDAASALALHCLLPLLSEHHLSIFYTAKPHIEPTNGTPKSLQNYARFESSLPETKTVFKQAKATKLNSINSDTDFAIYAATTPELVVSIRHMSILRAHVINTPRHGVINLHSGILPRYRGVMATFWAMLNKESRIGTTLHFIENNTIDTGSIIQCSNINVDYQKSYFWNTLSLYESGCTNIASAVNQIEQNQKILSSPQVDNGDYYSYPLEADIVNAEFRLFDHSDGLTSFLS